jgi:lipid IVA palmitoyltransferase
MCQTSGNNNQTTYMIKPAHFFSIFLLLTSSQSHAFCENSPALLANACEHIENTWAQGDDDLYIPFHAHHMRYAYTQEKIETFNEDSWGAGYGRSHYLDDGNWEGLYGMAFLDSHNDVEPIVGYAYQWMWGNQKAFHTGLGYTVFVTSRSDVMHYTPFPAALPVASINYNRMSINSTFVPGGNGNGNILFFWSRVGL